jgi:hypothetical protein
MVLPPLGNTTITKLINAKGNQRTKLINAKGKQRTKLINAKGTNVQKK